MKNTIKIISLFLVILITCSVTVYAADSYITLYGFSFNLNENGEAVIHSYDNRSADVAVPEKLMGAEVSEIDDHAFFGSTVIRSVSLEKATHLKTIGSNAFYGCTALTEINIPSNVTELGFGVFQNCTALKEVTLGNEISEIPNQAFYNCTSLESLDIPGSVSSIGTRSFSGCSSLKDILIPSSVSSISVNAFEGIDDLTIYCYEGSYAEEFAKENNIKYARPGNYELGDTNLDGVFNILDATIIQQYKIGKAEIPSYRGEVYADVNCDGAVTIRDATLIQMKLAKIIEDF